MREVERLSQFTKREPPRFRPLGDIEALRLEDARRGDRVVVAIKGHKGLDIFRVEIDKIKRHPETKQAGVVVRLLDNALDREAGSKVGLGGGTCAYTREAYNKFHERFIARFGYRHPAIP